MTEWPDFFDVKGWEEIAKREGIDLRPWTALGIATALLLIGGVFWLV